MTTTGQVVAGLSPDLPTRIGRGICLSIDWPENVAVVSYGGQTVRMPMVGVAPIPGQPCAVALWRGIPVCLGQVAHPSLGVISGPPAASRLPVLGDDGVTYQAAYDPNVTPWPTGQRVLLVWAGGDGGGPTIVVKLSADPAPPPVEPPPAGGPAPVTRDLYFDAAWSGSQWGTGGSGGGSFTTNLVYASSSMVGAWGYGTAVRDTIPDTAAIQQVEIFAAAQQAQFSGPNLGLHNLQGRGGVLTVTGAVNVALGTGWRGLPTSFGDALRSGQAFGIGAAHGGFSIFSPAGVNQSGRLHIRASW